MSAPGGATQSVKDMHDTMKRLPGESDEHLAARLYEAQMEVYSAWAGRDLDSPFEYLPEKVRQEWLEKAKDWPPKPEKT